MADLTASATTITTDIQNNTIKKHKKTKKSKKEVREEDTQGSKAKAAEPTVNVHSTKIPADVEEKLNRSVTAANRPKESAKKTIDCKRNHKDTHIERSCLPGSIVAAGIKVSSSIVDKDIEKQQDQAKAKKSETNPKSKLDEQKNQSKGKEPRQRRKTVDKDKEQEKNKENRPQSSARSVSSSKSTKRQSESQENFDKSFDKNQLVTQKVVRCKKPENNLIKEKKSTETDREPVKAFVEVKKAPVPAKGQQTELGARSSPLPLAITYPRPEAVQRAAAAKAKAEAEKAKAAAQPTKVFQAIFYPKGKPLAYIPRPQPPPPRSLPIAISITPEKVGIPGKGPGLGSAISNKDTKYDIPLAIFYTSEEEVRQAAYQRADVEHQTKVQKLAAEQFKARQEAATRLTLGLSPDEDGFESVAVVPKRKTPAKRNAAHFINESQEALINNNSVRNAFPGHAEYQKFMRNFRLQPVKDESLASQGAAIGRPNRTCLAYPLLSGLMQNEMVSIPAANMNGGLKATSNAGATGGVSSSVLANAPRVYLTPASTFLANRQSVAVTAAAGGTAVVGKVPNMVGNFNNINSTTTTGASITGAGTAVRYFSQFSKPTATMTGATVPRKFVNGDTIVLANGSKPVIFATTDKTAIQTGTGTGPGTGISLSSVLNGANRFLLPKADQPAETASATTASTTTSSATVIKDEASDSQQQNNPIDLVATEAGKPIDDPDAEPELDIVINNVVCSFSVRCHLKLRDIALHGANVEYRRENGMVTMKLRHPYTTASIWSSGRITCTGATSEIMAKVAARRYARCLGKLGFPTRFQNFRIVNVLGTCSMPWAIKIVNFSERHRENASYEPELHPGVTYKMRDPKATLKIFSTGSITVTAASVNDVEAAIQHIYPLAYEFRKQRSPEEIQHMKQKQKQYANTDSNETEEILATETKGTADNDIFVNTTAAHANTTTSSNESNLSASNSVNNIQRLKQFESYRQMSNQTQEERRHIPFTGSNNAPATSASSSSSTADNICANARRRATECWATKLQNKRPRYNDPGSTDTANAGNLARKFGNAAPVAAVGGKQQQQQQQQQQQILKALPGTTRIQSSTTTASMTALRTAGGSGTIITTSNSNKSTISRVRNAVAVNSTYKHQHLEREQSFSPSDFHVDDLIEEDDEMEMGMMQY